MQIEILGSGLMDGKLGTLFARAGHDEVFSYAHSDQKLKRLARSRQKATRARARSNWRRRFAKPGRLDAI